MYRLSLLCIISIHPPRAGRDDYPRILNSQQHHFNPPAPCGAGPVIQLLLIFQHGISIHPPRAGRDVHAVLNVFLYFNFNPPAPCGAGRRCYRQQWQQQRFQSTRPVRGGTTALWRQQKKSIFQSTRPVRGGTLLFKNPTVPFDFNPPAPCGAGRIQSMP